MKEVMDQWILIFCESNKPIGVDDVLRNGDFAVGNNIILEAIHKGEIAQDVELTIMDKDYNILFDIVEPIQLY